MVTSAHSRIVDLGARIKRPAGSMLFSEGERSTSVYAVVAGRIRIDVSTPTGGRLVIAVKEEGEIFGEFGAIDGGPRAGPATAISEVELVRVDAATFLEIVSTSPELSIAMLEAFSRQLRAAVARTTARNSYDTTGRLVHRLIELSERHRHHHRDATVIHLDLTQGDLAGWIGATREATARSLRTLRESGCLVTGRGRVTIIDLDALKEIGE